MKVFKVVLTHIGCSHVEADRYEEGETVKFFRRDSVIAEYPKASIQEITDSNLPGTAGGLLFSAERAED